MSRVAIMPVVVSAGTGKKSAPAPTMAPSWASRFSKKNVGRRWHTAASVSSSAASMRPSPLTGPWASRSCAPSLERWTTCVIPFARTAPAADSASARYHPNRSGAVQSLGESQKSASAPAVASRTYPASWSTPSRVSVRSRTSAGSFDASRTSSTRSVWPRPRRLRTRAEPIWPVGVVIAMDMGNSVEGGADQSRRIAVPGAVTVA